MAIIVLVGRVGGVGSGGIAVAGAAVAVAGRVAVGAVAGAVAGAGAVATVAGAVAAMAGAVAGAAVATVATVAVVMVVVDRDGGGHVKADGAAADGIDVPLYRRCCGGLGGVVDSDTAADDRVLA
jgi:hypothetical protein